ncbi:MAG: ribosome-binding factor [Patescibacteria group bacterium]|nr:ribosome-binding factor [Patescibacteria group bacterium]
MAHRVEKMNSLVREIFSALLEQEVSLKQGVLITIAKVDTTPDLRYTRVSVSVFPEQEEGYALATLRHEQSRLQKALNSKLSMKIRPRILIESDHTEQSADIIEKLLLEIKQEVKDE